MTQWFTSEATTPRNKVADNNFVTFVQKNYKHLDPSEVWFLDIGSGSGANSRYLANEGFFVIGIDPAKDASATYHVTAQAFLSTATPNTFDCIFDINTLCHVEEPLYEAIYAALKPGGKFFSIHPADGTEVDMSGKGYTRIADVLTMRQLLGRGFMRFDVRKCTNWNGNTKINSWQIEADK